MKKILEKTFNFVESVCKIMLIIQIIAVAIVVIGRQVFSKTPVWGEELTLFCLVWTSLLGAVLLLKNDGHIAVTAFDRFLPQKALWVLDLLAYLFLLFYAGMMLVYGIRLMEITSHNMMSALKIKSSWLYASMPVSSIGMIVILLEKIYLLMHHENAELDQEKE